MAIYATPLLCPSDQGRLVPNGYVSYCSKKTFAAFPAERGQTVTMNLANFVTIVLLQRNTGAPQK
ncbi:MAG: hypothetical protein EBZ50_08270 [Alphaproteobacteria bacterium]|nr:hypothetical protein [Alphaproteobacteria bacterium]